MPETLTTELADGVFTVTLNRPEALNTFTRQMMHELIAAFDRADADDEIRAVIVTGSGRAFCAGMDLSQGEKTFDYEARAGRGGRPPVDAAIGADGRIDWSHDVLRDGGGLLTLRIFGCLKPVIAAVNGAAVGVGATMLLPMDIRLASEGARFGFVFSRRGIVPEACSSWFLPRVVGVNRALEWTLSGRVFPATEALESGLVRKLLPPEALLPAARQLAQEIADNAAPVSVALTRQMMWRMLGAPHPMMAHRIDSRGMFARGRSADVREGIAAFLEKRAPRFTDRVSNDMPEWFPWWQDPPYE